MKKISVIFGTRQEEINLAPVILALQREDGIEVEVCVTAQHREMLDQVTELFGIEPDVDLDLMRAGQSLGELTSKAVAALDDYLGRSRPDLVLVQGDTTTVFCAALAAFYQHIPVGHVEAGLRSGDMEAPWPEEGNRVLASHLARLHFAPTESSRRNLLRENVLNEHIFVTGNPVIDALFRAVEELKLRHLELPEGVKEAAGGGRRMVLITGHRRESFGEGFQQICEAILRLAEKYEDVEFVYPVHLNPEVRTPVDAILRPRKLKNVHLCAPLSYLPFVALMERSSVILTDSGGIQEEAPSLGKPVLVMREVTERPEALEAGTVRLVGTESARIVGEVSALLDDAALYREMSRAHNPYGDGKASERIAAACLEFLGGEECESPLSQ